MHPQKNFSAFGGRPVGAKWLGVSPSGDQALRPGPDRRCAAGPRKALSRQGARWAQKWLAARFALCFASQRIAAEPLTITLAGARQRVDAQSPQGSRSVAAGLCNFNIVLHFHDILSCDKETRLQWLSRLASSGLKISEVLRAVARYEHLRDFLNVRLQPARHNPYYQYEYR